MTIRRLAARNMPIVQNATSHIVNTIESVFQRLSLWLSCTRQPVMFSLTYPCSYTRKLCLKLFYNVRKFSPLCFKPAKLMFLDGQLYCMHPKHTPTNWRTLHCHRVRHSSCIESFDSGALHPCFNKDSSALQVV